MTDEELELYATPKAAVDLLLEHEQISDTVLDPCTGLGHIAEVLKTAGHDVECWDIKQRSYPLDKVGNFLEYDGKWDGDIVMNPPFKQYGEFTAHAMQMLNDGCRLYVLIPQGMLDGLKRYSQMNGWKECERVWVFPRRVLCGAMGKFDTLVGKGYNWVVFQKGFTGTAELCWFDPDSYVSNKKGEDHMLA